MIFDLSRKKILITGANGLIGSFISKKLVDRGADVFAIDKSDNSEESSPERIVNFKVDLTVESNVVNLVDELPMLDGVLNLVGKNAPLEKEKKFSKLENLTSNEWRESFAANVDSNFFLIKHLVHKKKLNKFASIVNTASTYSIVSPNQDLYENNVKPIDYVASKSLIPNMTRYLATYLSKEEIRVNCITPHGVENSHSEAFKKRFSEMSPMGRMCKVEELEGPIVFLLSKASSYMTGSNLIVDGGWTAW